MKPGDVVKDRRGALADVCAIAPDGRVWVKARSDGRRYLMRRERLLTLS